MQRQESENAKLKAQIAKLNQSEEQKSKIISWLESEKEQLVYRCEQKDDSCKELSKQLADLETKFNAYRQEQAAKQYGLEVETEKLQAEVDKRRRKDQVKDKVISTIETENKHLALQFGQKNEECLSLLMLINGYRLKEEELKQL